MSELLYETKIPMKVFETKQAAIDYYASFKEAYDAKGPKELLMWVDGNLIKAYSHPSSDSINPNLLTGENYLLDDYVPDSPLKPDSVAEPTIEFALYHRDGDEYELVAKMTCETEGATIMFGFPEEGVVSEYYDYYEILEDPENSVEIDGEKYVTLGSDGSDELTLMAYGQFDDVTSETVTETYTPGSIPTPTPTPSTVADPVITIVEAELPNGSIKICFNITCETEGATIMFKLASVQDYIDYAHAIEEATQAGQTTEIDGETYLVYPDYTEELTVYAYAELDGDTSNTVSETYTKYIFNVAINGGGGLVSQDGGEPTGGISAEFVPGENTFEFEAIPDTGYKFVNWTDENNEEITTDNPYEVTPTKNATIYANFEATTANITISATPAGYGSVDAAGSTIIGESYTVMATANTGYTFVNWTENGTEVSTSANYTFTVTGDRTLVANFATA